MIIDRDVDLKDAVDKIVAGASLITASSALMSSSFLRRTNATKKQSKRSLRPGRFGSLRTKARCRNYERLCSEMAI